jgi:hypothetical protein
MIRFKRARGFVLVVCVICSVAMVAIAMALVFTAGSNKMVAAKGASIDESESIAIAGMERSVAYAERVADVERDFDRLLDPELGISCVAATNANTHLGTSGLPRFSDGDVVVVDGKSFRRVPYGRGAYLIRFDDDVDDTVVNPAWAPFTNNHAVNGCDEGPGATGFAGGHNAFRDRNRSVWISVIGIYPGTDIAKARHRTSLRRLHISTARLPAAAFFVGDDIDVNSLTFCSGLGDVGASDDITIGASAVCGTMAASDDITRGSVVATGPVCTTSETECAPTGVSPDTPLPAFDTIAPLLTGQGNLDSSSGDWLNTTNLACNLFARDGDGGGLFFWDPTRTGCAAGPPGGDGGPPLTIIVSPPASYTSCWVPLFVLVGGAVTDPLGWDEVDDGGAGTSGGWHPKAVADTPGLAGFVANKPNWQSCTVKWKTEGVVSCTNCDDTNLVIGHNGNTVVIDGNVPTAMPAITLRFETTFTEANFRNITVPTAANDADNVPANWLPLSLLLGNELDLNGGAELALGFGRGGFSPSLVVDGKIKLSGTTAVTVAGSLLADEVDADGTSDFTGYGLVLVRHKFKADDVYVDYDEDLGSAPPPVPAPPTTSRTIR